MLSEILRTIFVLQHLVQPCPAVSGGHSSSPACAASPGHPYTASLACDLLAVLTHLPFPPLPYGGPYYGSPILLLVIVSGYKQSLVQ